MSLKRQLTAVLLGVLMALPAVPAWAQQTVRIVGTVRDETNAIALPGTPVEVVGTGHVVYTDVDGRYILTVPPGTHQVKVVLDGYQEKLVSITTGGRADSHPRHRHRHEPLCRDGQRHGPVR